jgi:hypothetical protein
MVDVTSDGSAKISGRQEEIVVRFTRTPASELGAGSVYAKRGRSRDGTVIAKSDESPLRCVSGAIRVPVVSRCMVLRRVLGQGVAPTI